MFKNNKINMALSLIIAIVLWLYVAGQVDPKTDKKITGIEIEFLNTDSLQNNGLDFASASEKQVSVTLEGKRSQLNRVDKDDIHVTADLTRCIRGENTVTLKAATSKKAEIEKISPSVITVKVEERVNNSKPVKVKFTGKRVKNREPGNVRTDPDNVNVYGAKSIVNKVDNIQVSVPRNSIKIDDTTVTAKAVPVDSSGKKVENVWLSTKNVAVTASMMETKEVDLDVKTTGSVSDGMQLEEIKLPEKVTIRGTQDTLADITGVQGEQIDISGLNKTTTIPIELSLPYGVELASESEDISARVVLKELASMSFDVQTAAIEKNGLEKGYTASITENAISITAKGTDDQMEGFSTDDIVCSVDLKNLEEGTHEVAVKVTTNDKIHSVAVTPEKVKVNISKE